MHSCITILLSNPFTSYATYWHNMHHILVCWRGSMAYVCKPKVVSDPAPQSEFNGASKIRVALASTLEERQMAVAVRAAVFLGEEGGRYADQYDPNDHSASFLLVFVGDEPVGTLRVRWYGGFARLERLAVRREYRSFAVLRALIQAAMMLAADKGFSAVSGLTRLPGVSFWRRQGGRIAGPSIATPLGDTMPMVVDLTRRMSSRMPAKVDQLGSPDLEYRLYGWEGDVL
jgi:GNAT superfamily N-acetyltransferase